MGGENVRCERVGCETILGANGPDTPGSSPVGDKDDFVRRNMIPDSGYTKIDYCFDLQTCNLKHVLDICTCTCKQIVIIISGLIVHVYHVSKI